MGPALEGSVAFLLKVFLKSDPLHQTAPRDEAILEEGRLLVQMLAVLFCLSMARNQTEKNVVFRKQTAGFPLMNILQAQNPYYLYLYLEARSTPASSMVSSMASVPTGMMGVTWRSTHDQ
jgi:hypothetical protein